jgi:methionyl-tRNA synthetase
MTDTYYVTTPIFYVNAEPHLGHLYVALMGDSLRRFHRQRGRDVYFLTGTDEHSQKIERAAVGRGMPTAQFVDQLAGVFKGIFDSWGVEYDQFIRTTFDYHKAGVQQLWRRCEEAGYLYKGEYAGWYCIPDNAFVDGPKDADPPPSCPECGGPTEWVAEETYFFKLSAFQDRLLAHYCAHPEFVQPEVRRNEVVSFVEGGLRDLSVSRVTATWGIPVPGDPKHFMYVWFDALSNYITALGYGNEPDANWRFWPANAHLVGKDIVRFHAVYWPAFLMAAGVELPRSVMVHGMWLSGGRRMMKRLGNGIDIPVLDRHFSHDAVRYYCLSEKSFGGDGDFTYEALIDRTNADLANGLGNLSSRALTMLQKYFDGAVPQATGDAAVRAAVENAAAEFVREFEAYNFKRALEGVREAMATVDKHISDTKPWALAKDESRRGELAEIIYTSLEALRIFTVLLAPALPDGAPEIWRQLGLDGAPDDVDPGAVAWGGLAAGHRIGQVGPIFPRLNKEQIMSDIKKQAAPTVPAQAAPEPAAAVQAAPVQVAPVQTPEHATQADPTVAAEPEYITIDDFAKVDLRVGQVLEASRIEGADKLLKLRVDVGEAEPRQVLAGIAQYYEPESLVGRKIVVVANLKPRKMRGLESQGMLVAASVGEEGRPVIATFAEDVPNGARLK